MYELITQYQTAVDLKIICDDSIQKDALQKLQQVLDDLLAFNPGRYVGVRRVVKGLYLYGTVGVGKTYLMDLFFETLPFSQKSRYHFHAFMQWVDAALRKLQGTKNPILCIAKQISQTTRVLCLDEFLVYDVADALILSELLQALFTHKVVLVATSNTAVENLYAGGVQRDRFLPAIAAISKHCNTFHLQNKNDYRQGRTELAYRYLTPLGIENTKVLEQQFTEQALEPILDAGEITVQHRSIQFIKKSGKLIWFDFAVLCQIPRCQLDYLELALRFDTIFLSNVPAFTESDTTCVVLFILLIDVLYDQSISIVINAAVPIEQLYTQGPFREQFARTMSRLMEMQSEYYKSKALQ